MNKIIAGMDKSGNPTNNNRFMSVVITTNDYLNSIRNALGLKAIHMSTMRNKVQRNDLISKLNFDNTQSIVLCINIEQHTVIEKIKNRKFIKDKRIPAAKIYKAFNCILMNELYDKLTNFLAQHKCALTDAVFHCDDDCMDFVKDAGLCNTRIESYVHDLADVVAWCNNKGIEPKGVISIDLSSIIETKMETVLKSK